MCTLVRTADDKRRTPHFALYAAADVCVQSVDKGMPLTLSRSIKYMFANLTLARLLRKPTCSCIPVHKTVESVPVR